MKIYVKLNNNFFKIVILITALIYTSKLIGQCSENFESNNLINSFTPIPYNRYNSITGIATPSLIPSGSVTTISITDSQYSYYKNFNPTNINLTHLNNRDTTKYNWQIISKRKDRFFNCLSTVNHGSKALKMGREYFPESGVEGYKTIISGPATILNFSYAMVTEDPNDHPINERPYFGVRVNGTFYPINRSYTSLSSTTPIYSSDDGYNIIYNGLKIIPWTCASVNLPAGYKEVEFLLGDCSHGGHWAYVYLDDIFCSSTSSFCNSAYITKLEGFPCSPKLNGVLVYQSSSPITDIKIGLYQNGVKKYTSSSVLSKFDPLSGKLTILNLENYFPTNFYPAEQFDLVIEVYGISGNLLFTSPKEGMICEYEDVVFGCYNRANISSINYSRDRCGNYSLAGKFNPTIFYPGKSNQSVASYSDLFVSTNELPNLLSISGDYNPVTKDFLFSPSYYENLISRGKFHDLFFEIEEIGAFGKFRTKLNDGIIKNSSYSILSSRGNARDNCTPKKTCQYEGPNDFFVKNNQQIAKKNNHQFFTGKCKMDVEFEYVEWTNFTGVSLVRDSIYDHRKCDTCGDTILCYKVIEQKDLTDDCYCKFNFKKFIDSFQFAKNAPIIDCYTLIQFDSIYDCGKDSMKYILKYKLNQQYRSKDIFVTIKILNVCDLATCENYICNSSAGIVLNPILNNLRMNFRPQEEKIYNVKRENLTTDNIRKGETYNEFNPLYRFESNTGWKLSTNNNWITKDFTTNFDEKGNQIESKDPLNIYTSYKYGFNKSFITSIAKNAKYKECINLSFEDEYFNVDPNKNYSSGFKKEFYLPKIGKGIDNTNIKSSFDDIYNISYADVVENVGHTGNNSYFIKPYFGIFGGPFFSAKEPFLIKTIQLCGPNDPDYSAPTYEVNTNTVNSINNSYNPAFQLEKGKKYIISYWVKDAPNGLNQFFSFFDRGYIDVGFDCKALNSVKSNIVKGNPIEGWERDFFEFEIPQNANLFKLIFMPNSNGSYFDDIRIFPSDGNMKSYIYDPITLRFTAELDENNFATFYDYDEQGQLIRIRKETDRGIMTIKESRTSLKQN